MKKALLGLTGALLATSAFTAANAAVISTAAGTQAAVTAAGTNYGGTNGTSAINSFAAENVTAAAQTVGANTDIGDVFVSLANSIGGGGNNATFAIRINITGLQFNSPTSYTLTPNIGGGGGTENSCSPFSQSATSLVFTCTYSSTATTPAAITSLRLQTAAAPFISTAAGSATAIAIDATVAPDTNFLSTIESAPSATIARLIDGLAVSIRTPATVTIQQTGSPEFSALTAAAFDAATGQGGTTATAGAFGNIRAILGSTTGGSATIQNRDGSTIDIDAALTTATLVVTSDIITDASLTGVEIVDLSGPTVLASRTKAANASAFVGNTVTFPATVLDDTVVNNISGESDIVVRGVFSGTAAIPAATAGTIAFDVLSAATYTDEASVTGTAAAFSRGGFNAQLNNFYTLTSAYESFIRLVNTSASAGTATITLQNADTGAAVCTATTPSVAPNATLEASRATIVALCGAQLPATLPTYLNARISAAFGGYAQHVVWNNRQIVTDLSGQRP